MDSRADRGTSWAEGRGWDASCGVHAGAAGAAWRGRARPHRQDVCRSCRGRPGRQSRRDGFCGRLRSSGVPRHGDFWDERTGPSFCESLAACYACRRRPSVRRTRRFDGRGCAPSEQRAARAKSRGRSRPSDAAWQAGSSSAVARRKAQSLESKARSLTLRVTLQRHCSDAVAAPEVASLGWSCLWREDGDQPKQSAKEGLVALYHKYSRGTRSHPAA
jgi:hypothetical protein